MLVHDLRRHVNRLFRKRDRLGHLPPPGVRNKSVEFRRLAAFQKKVPAGFGSDHESVPVLVHVRPHQRPLHGERRCRRAQVQLAVHHEGITLRQEWIVDRLKVKHWDGVAHRDAHGVRNLIPAVCGFDAGHDAPLVSKARGGAPHKPRALSFAGDAVPRGRRQHCFVVRLHVHCYLGRIGRISRIGRIAHGAPGRGARRLCCRARHSVVIGRPLASARRARARAQGQSWRRCRAARRCS